MDQESFIVEVLQLAKSASAASEQGKTGLARAVLERLRELLNFGLYDPDSADQKIEALLESDGT